MPERLYYVISDDNCKFESMTKEQILAAITQAVEGHVITDVDTGFVQTVKEQHHGEGLKFWIGSTAEYNALTEKDQSTFYILTDDTILEELETEMASLQTGLDSVNANIRTLAEILQSDLAKEMHVFTSEQIASGEVNIELAKLEYDSNGTHHSLRLDQFSQVKVALSDDEFVLCTVCNMGSGVTRILGFGTKISNNDQMAMQVSVNLECLSDSTHHSVIGNKSKLIALQDNVAPYVDTVTIHGIYGVGYKLHN